MPPIKLFALSTCSHCKNTRKFLDENQVHYDCVEVDQCPLDQKDQVIAEVRKYNPSLSFPTLVIGDKVIVGFKEKEIRELLGL
ncbi:MAG: glutaredoxin family protein [Desulfarculus sp.]|nr:glutaredoxin family protein [Desulfarculus sp.]